MGLSTHRLRIAIVCVAVGILYKLAMFGLDVLEYRQLRDGVDRYFTRVTAYDPAGVFVMRVLQRNEYYDWVVARSPPIELVAYILVFAMECFLAAIAVVSLWHWWKRRRQPMHP